MKGARQACKKTHLPVSYHERVHVLRLEDILVSFQGQRIQPAECQFGEGGSVALGCHVVYVL